MTDIPQQLDNVSLKLKANVYFEGGVVSHTIVEKGGSKKTVGLIRPGSYHFNTGAPERMGILAGQCEVLFAGEKEWKSFAANQTFNIPGNSFFDIRVKDGLAEYLCTFE